MKCWLRADAALIIVAWTNTGWIADTFNKCFPEHKPKFVAADLLATQMSKPDTDLIYSALPV